MPYADTIAAHKQQRGHSATRMRSRKRPNQSGKKNTPRYIFRTIFLKDSMVKVLHTRGGTGSDHVQTPPLSINLASQLSDSVRHHARRPKSENSRNAPFATENRNFSNLLRQKSFKIAQTPRRILFQHLRDRYTLPQKSCYASTTTEAI